VTADQVFASPQFQKLSEQQRVFLKALVENGWDKLDAAYKAWKPTSDASAMAMANRALSNPRVSSLVTLIDPSKSRMTKEEALEIAAKHARSATKASDALKALEFVAELEGWTTDAPRSSSDSSEGSIYDQAAALEKQQK
jgi:hypothetical protein